MIQYTITSDTLRFLGISKLSDLPEYVESRKQLEEVELEAETEDKDSDGE